MMPREVVISFRVGQFGDSLVALPALQAVRKKHPQAYHVLLTNAPPKPGMVSAKSVLAPSALFDQVIEFTATPKGYLGVAKELKGLKANHVYLLTPFRRRSQVIRDALFWQVVAPGATIHGRWSSMRRLAERARDGGLLRLEKEADRLLSIVTEGEERRPEFPMLRATEKETEQARTLLKVLQGELRLGLGIGSKMGSKLWPLERYEAVVRDLNLKMASVDFVVLGGPEDAAAAEQLIQALPEVSIINTAGRASIMCSAAILQELDLYVGNDTGTMHLAAVMGTPTVGIFSARDNPGKWEPFGETTVLRTSVPCEGCMAIECPIPEHPCLTGISVEQVVEAVTSSLARRLLDRGAE